MKQGMTNFALLMDLLDVKAADLYPEVGADKTLVSRWRTGSRKLVTGHHWAREIAAYFVRVDNARTQPMVEKVLQAYYPGEPTDTPERRTALLTHWLTYSRQREENYKRQRTGLFGTLSETIQRLSTPEPSPEPSEEVEPPPEPLANTVIHGVKGAQGSVLSFFALLLAQQEPQEAMFVCPEGLAMFTRDIRFAPLLLARLREVFASGHRLHVVLRTDYKMTDVSNFSGPWLAAHLLGHVTSHYYDEFHRSYCDKLLGVVPGKMAMKVWGDKRNREDGIRTALLFDSDSVASAWKEYQGFRKRSQSRFQYRLFEEPHDFLKGILPLPDREHLQIAQLPHFCVAERDAFQESLMLDAQEMAQVEASFPTLLVTPKFYDSETLVRHIFCEEEICAALTKSRHLLPELSVFLKRRVYMCAKGLRDHLALIRNLLETHKHYEVCFLPAEAFRRLSLQLACWGDRAAIGWISGEMSAACKDYTNVNALTGFCQSVWDQIPTARRQRREALSKLDAWLKQADHMAEGAAAQTPCRPAAGA